VKELLYERLEDVVQDELFPEVDLALREGHHIDASDTTRYGFLAEAQALLEGFYRRYACELIRSPDGYFYLLPSGERLGRRHLSVGEMLVGQALALLYLDPATIQAAGVLPRAQLLELLANLVGQDKLVAELNPRRRRRDERIAEELVRKELDKALRTLAALGFVELMEDERLRLRAPLLRFTEPVRGLGSPEDAMRQLIAQGQVVSLETSEPEEEEQG